MIVSVPVATVWSDPDSPRQVDAPGVADRPDLAAWMAALTPPERLGLHGRTVTQALLGEPATVIEEHGAWARVALPWQPAEDPRGYLGWLRRAHLAEGDAVAAGAPAYVATEPTAVLTTADGPVEISFGTRLPRDGDRVLLPGGATATAPSAALQADPIALARQFLGLPYLWAGVSGWGLDCSGLAHLVHRVLGLTIPRDSPAQRDGARAVDLDRAGAGDLYFFAHEDGRVYHVGFSTSAPPHEPRLMLHAPEGDETDHGRIEDASMTPRRTADLVAAGTFLHDVEQGVAQE